MPSERQRQLAEICGIDVSGLSIRSAAAALQVPLAESVLNIVGQRATTPDQKDIARQLNLSEHSEFMEIAALQIQAEFVRRNEVAFEKFGFEPGMRVKFIGGPNIRGLPYRIGEEFVISTVKEDGRIYLKSTSGGAAFASQFEPAT